MTKTKEEKFLLKLSERAKEESRDAFLIGRELGYNDKVVKNILNVLAKANFIQKLEGNFVCITANGIRLLEELD